MENYSFVPLIFSKYSNTNTQCFALQSDRYSKNRKWRWDGTCNTKNGNIRHSQRKRLDLSQKYTGDIVIYPHFVFETGIVTEAHSNGCMSLKIFKFEDIHSATTLSASKRKNTIQPEILNNIHGHDTCFLFV